MSASFYTNVVVWGGKILYRGVDAGRRVREKIDYHPKLFIRSSEASKHKTVHGEYVKGIQPGNIKECRNFCNQYRGVSGFRVYGNQKYEYAYIAEHFPNEIEWSRDYINVTNIDIEVGSETGFPEPETASEPITAITMKTRNEYVVFGCGKYDNWRDDVRYVMCHDEIDLIKRFLDEWTGNYPDVITGWNVKFFDIPYLVNRITKLLGEKFARRLSPWNTISDRSDKVMGREHPFHVLLGISTLDYLELYRSNLRAAPTQESYTLNHICSVEIGEKKLSYEEYGNLHRLYKLDYQKFIDYNIRDVELVGKLDNKLKLIDLALTIAYDSHSNYDDVFKQVRMWDNIIFNELRKENMVLPPIEEKTKNEAYVGAFVKEPVPDLYHWVASFDLNSLYPHLIMQYNISPDTFIDPEEYTVGMRDFISKNHVTVHKMLEQKIDTSSLKTMDVTLTPNGQFFTVDRQGFLTRIMENMYKDRVVYKKKMNEAKRALQKESNSTKRVELENSIARYNNLQMAKKVCLNSAYGSLGSQYFRFFDVRQAAAITTAGQLTIQWIERKLNGYLNRILNTEEKDYVIAMDTDSVYLNLAELVRQSFGDDLETAEPRRVIAFMDSACENKLQPFIDRAFEELARYTNALAQKMIMKREALADRGVWTAKKRYVLNVYNNEGIEYATPQIKVTGLEMVKSSTPAACREKLNEALDVLMNGTENDMIQFIDDFREEFRTLPIPEIAFPRGVNGIEKYTGTNTMFVKSTPIHVRGSIVYNHLLKKHGIEKDYPAIHEGEKIKFIYMREPNVARSNIISFPHILPKEFGLDDAIDFDLQFEKSFLDPLKVILNIIGWKSEKTNTLDLFFS